MLRIKQSINGLFPRSKQTEEEFRELYQPNRREEGISSFLLIRRHPDLNRGKGICNPPPYHSAMSPKWYKIDENFPALLNFYCLTPCNPFHKRKTLIHPFDWLYSIWNNAKNIFSLFYWKIKYAFSTDKFEPVTIDCLLRIYEWFWDLNLKLCFPNDLRKYNLRQKQSVLIFSIEKPFQFEL